ncbi:MAG: hypothetical protein H8E45_10605 [Proteobacteria bacterium]|nr:hypothetical protein [Pseudomonadota bacterium]
MALKDNETFESSGEDSGTEWPIAIDVPVVLPEGHYVAIGVGSSNVYEYKGKKKLAVYFKIQEGPGEVDAESSCGITRDNPDYKAEWGEVLKVHYTVETGGGRTGSAGATTQYHRAWVLANGKQPARRDRLSPEVFKDKYFVVKLRTVVTDSDKEPLEEINQYSVVGKLVSFLPDYDVAKECGEIPY